MPLGQKFEADWAPGDPITPTFYCGHARLSPPRRRIVSDGSTQYRRQCLDCGYATGPAVAKEAALRQCNGAPFDERLAEAGVAASEDRIRQKEDGRLAKLAARREEHAAYLQTDAWRSKREKVLRRCEGRCEGCFDRPAVEVHHLTYAHHKHELLFELVALCRECHALARDRKEIA
jgi:5-methylcytosine-specific restriction endonuclease McrA